MAQLITYEGQTYSFGDDFTDEEIAEALKTIPVAGPEPEPEPEPQVEAPPVAPEPAEGFFERTADVVEAGARNFAGSTATGLSSALEYFDAAPETQDELDAFADRQEKAAQEIAPVKALQEAEGVGDVVSSAYEYLAQSSPHMAAMLGGAWAGGKAGAALTSWIPPVGWGAVARGIGTFGGGLLGGATATFNSFFGNNVQEAEKVKGRELNAGELENAAMAAAGQSVADAIISKLLPHKGSPSMLRNTIKKFMQGSAIEGTTEVLQETLGILQANDWNLDSLSTPESKYRLTEAALAGAAIGGPLGGITGPFTTTKPPVQTEEPPPQPETEVETAETEEVLALPKPATTPTGDDAQGTVEGNPVEFAEDVLENWPTGEALPLEFNIEEDAKGWRVTTSDNRVLTPYFKDRTQADQALMAFRAGKDGLWERRAEDVIQREADRALENLKVQERAALQSVARELVMPVTDFSEEELFEALGRDEKKVSRVLAGLEKLPNGLRDEITWEDVVTLHNKRPKLVTQADLDILLDYKKPETAKGLVQPADILTIAESMNINADPKKKKIQIGNQKRKKHRLTATDRNFTLYAKRLTGQKEIHAMSQTQLQVLADGLSKINNGQPFNEKTNIPIAERPPFTETQIERAVQGLKTDETFAEEKGQLKPASRKSIIKSIAASTEFLSEGDREAVLAELDRRGILLKDKGGKYKLRRPVRVQRLTFEEEVPSRPRPEVNPDGTYGSQAEGLEIIPGQVDVATEIEEAMRARLDRRGLKDVRLAFVESIPNQPRARAVFRPGKNGRHLILLALDAIPMDVRGNIKKIHERLAARLDHEAVHALVENGVITPADMDRLSGAIESEIAWDWDGDVRSDETYYNQAKRLYAPLGLSDVDIREEAIANMFRDFTMGKTTLSPPVKSIWQKIVNFFRDIALSAREKGVNDARELFQRIDQAAPSATVTTNESHSPENYHPPSNVSDTEMGGVKLEVASRGTVPANISTNIQLAAITDYFNRNMRRLQLVGAMTRKWKLDRIIPDNERVAVRTDYRTKAAINEGVLDNVPPELAPMTGQTFAMQGVHLLSDKTGNPNLEDVAGYDTSVTLNDVEFRIDEGARNDLLKGVPTDVPPALTHGNIVKGQDSTDGVPIVFNPYRQHLFVREDNGLAVKGADQVTLVNGKAYARGNIEYWTQATAPATEAESNVLYEDGVEEYARPSLDLQGPDFDVSSLSTLYDPAFPTEKPGSRSIWQIITRLADRALAAWGGPLAGFDQENMETIARIMSAEAREALKKSGNAADWYAEDINKMVDILALNGGPYPELKTDGNARAAFSLALAVTSINTQVESNMKNALAVYDAYKQTGKFPNMGWGVAASGMRKKFRDLNKIIDDLGLDGAVTFMNTPFTKAQLVRLGFPGSALAGVSPEGRVYGSYLLGPKLGSFYQNLMGNYDTITMDKWFMRTWNRITGQFPTEEDILVAAQGIVNGRAARSANRLGVDLTGAQDSPDATIDAAIRLANALDREWQQRKKAGASADQKLGVTTQAQAFQDLMSGDEVPGAAKRTFMDQTVRRALEILGDYNINVPPASFQAIIWYPEQDLFRKMGMQPEGRERSYGAAAVKTMKEKGYGGQVDATVRALARRGAQPTGRDVGNAALSGTPQLQRDALEGRDRTRFIRYHTAKAFRESFGPRFGTKKSPTPYERKSVGVTQFVLADGTTLKVPTEAVYTPKKKASDPASPVNYLIPAGISMPKFVELKYGDPEAVSFFHSRIMNAQASTQFANAVTVYPQEAYQEKRLFVTLDGGAGFALDNGDIQSMFKDSAAPYQQVSFSQLVMAIDQGGRTLDAFDTVLPELYSFLGFEPVSRIPFESVALPKGVDVEAFKKAFADFRDGTPDLVFMVFNPNNYELYSEPSEAVRQEQMSADYDEAVEAQDIALSEIRTGINDGFDMDGALYELGDLRRPSTADHNQEFWDAYNKKYAADRNNQGDVMHPNTMVPAPFATRDNPTTRWGRLLWRDLDDLGKVLPVEVNVRLGYDLPNKNGFISGYGQRHAQAHDEEFRQYTPYPSATAALEAFLQEFADQTAAEGLTDKNSKKKYINRMMSKDKDLSFSAFEQGDPERANRKVGFEWSQPGLRNPIRFAFTAYRDRQTGRMAFTLVTAYPVTQQVNRAENKRRYRDRKSNVKEYHPEKLSEVAREAASAAEEMTPKAQQKLVSSVVHKGGTLTLPKPKIDDKARSFYSEPYDTRTKTDTEDSGGGRGEPTRDRGGRDASRSIAPLAGAPTVQGAAGPDPTLVRVAEDYAAKANIPFSRQGEYVSVDPEFAARIALAYEAMPHAPNDPAVKAAYASLIEQTLAQYEALTEAGYTFTFFDSETDPYEGNPWNAMRDLRANKTMAVYGTYDGYGTEGITGAVIEENPMLADTGLRWPDQGGEQRMVTANDLFRAVHDAFGHGLEGAGFRGRGEENAFQAHVRLFTGDAVAALASETRGQNSWLNFGPHGENNQTAKLEDTVFAEQKTGLMPSWTWEEKIAKPEERYDLAAFDLDVEYYHGTNTDFPAFKEGITFVADNPKTAEYYAGDVFRDDGSPNIIPVNLRKGLNVFDVDNPEHIKRLRESDYYKSNKEELDGYAYAGEGDFVDAVEAGNYDAIEESGLVDWIRENGFEGFTTYEQYGKNIAVFDPKNIRFRFAKYELGSPEFKNWFGDSKVVDPDGTPTVVYHSTESDFSAFKQISHFGTRQAAHDRLPLKHSSFETREWEGSNILPVYLSMQNPLDVGREENDYGGVWENDNEMFRRVAEVLKSRGETELGTQIEETIDEGPEDQYLLRGGTPNSHRNSAKLLMEAGYDGIVYENREEDAGSTSYITLEPSQIKSVLNQGTYDPESPDIRYELSAQQRRVMDSVGGSTTKETFADKILRVAQMFGTRPVAKDDPKSFPHFGQWFRTNVFDRFDPIRRAELRAWGKLGNDLRELTADVGAWAAFRMLKRSIGVFQTALTRGVPTYRNGIFTSEPLPEGTTRPDGRPITIGGEPVAGTEFGLLQIFEPLVRNRNLNRPDTMREFQSYGVARRAARLIQEGRQRLMTVEDIITQLAMADTIPEIVARFNSPSIDAAYVQRVLDQTVPVEKRALFGDGRSVDFQEIFDAYQAWNSGQVQMMVDSGVISQEMAQTWIETSDYIPYYRQMAEKNNYGNLDDMFKIYNNIRPPEKLVGEQNVWTIDIITTNPDGTRNTIQAPQVFNSEEEAKVYAGKLRSENGDAAFISDPRQTIAPMLDLLETVSQNSLAAIQTSMANVATQRAVRNLVLIDEASAAPKGVTEGVVRFRVNGEEKAYLIHDPAMYTSLTVLDDRQGPILKLFGMPATLLRNFVTRTPEFMLSNMLRDTLSAWAVSGKNGVPVLNTAVGFVDALRGSTSGKALSAAGVWAGHDFQDDPTDAATAMRDLYVYRQRGGENWWNPLGAIYNKLGKWSAASDAATRIKVYEDVLRETGNEAQAVFEAVEVLNFGAKGASGIIKVATATIPFLNARLQGLDLFYRASGIGTGGFTADSQSDRVKRRFWARGATLAALSALYWQLVHDDEDWLAQEAHVKDSYWIIPMPEGPPIKIPIPFEVGLMFKVIPERLMGYIKGQETNRDMFDSFKRGVQSTLEINPYPQAVLPWHEAATNFSYFTGRPVEPKSMADIEAGHRYNERTSQLAISMGRALNDARHVLPEEFVSPMRIDHMMKGYTGTLGTYILDVVDWGWRNLGDNVERPSRSAYEYPVMRRFFAKEAGRGIVTQAYELMDEVNQALNTLKKMEETLGLEVDAMEFEAKRAPLLAVSEELKPIKQELAELRKERQNVFADPAMTADEKRRAMEIIAVLEQQAVANVPRLRRWAFD